MRYGKLLFLLLISCQALAVQAQTPLNYGHRYELDSEVYQENRRYMVSLPERYNASDRKYPVLYVIDGDFQFRHVSTTVNSMARLGKTPPMIVVGVALQGQKDYLHSTTWPSADNPEYGGAEKLQRFLRTELIPAIDKRYRTSGRRALAGYSLGGLFTLYSMMATDTPFSAFLAMSPSAWYDDNGINKRMADFLRKERELPPLFLSLANERQMGVTELLETIQREGPKSWEVGYKHYPEETHYSTALPALYDGLEYLSPDYFTDMRELMAFENYREALDHFAQKKSLWSGFHFEWLQAYTLGKYLYYSEQTDAMEQALTQAGELFPQDLAELSAGFAKVLNSREKPGLAQKLLLRTKSQGWNHADWHQQLSLTYQAQEKNELAERHHRKALELAESQGLESWEWWELNP